MSESEIDRFTNQKRRVMTEKEFDSKWGGYGGKNFCALCNHTFRDGDRWRWVYANGPKPEGQHSFGNFCVCDLCDGPDVLERYQAACLLIYASVHDRGEGHWPVNIAANLLTAHGEQANLMAQLAANKRLIGQLVRALSGLADDVEKVARDSYSTCDDTFDDDFKTEDPTGYKVWKAAKAALALAADATKEGR